MDARYPVSIKGVILERGRVVLLENERGEWELPGGRLEPTEQPESCLEREIAEELGVAAKTGRILGSELFEVIQSRLVFVVTYEALVAGGLATLTVSAEHRRARLVPLAALGELNLPSAYRRSIHRAVDILDRFPRN